MRWSWFSTHYGFETKENIARAYQVAVPRCSASLADGNTVNLALDISAKHSLIVRSRTAQTRLTRAVLVHHGDEYAPGHRPSSNMLDRLSWRQTTEPTRLGTVAPPNLPLAVVRQGVDEPELVFFAFVLLTAQRMKQVLFV